jgi:hypothetical protein
MKPYRHGTHAAGCVGFRQAYITGYSDRANAFYKKLGACWQKQWFHYELA